MRIRCMACDAEINLDHVIFHDYEGPVKCFCCETILEVKTSHGVLRMQGERIPPKLVGAQAELPLGGCFPTEADNG